LCDVPPVPPDVIQDQPFSQRQITQRQFVRAEPSHDCVEEDGACHDQIGATGIETRNGQAMFEIDPDDLFSQPADLLGGDVQVAQLRR
jgi:hypothetical protein